VTAIAQPALPARAPVDDGSGGSSLRSERSIALIRIAIVGVVMWIYLGSLGIQRSLGPAAIVILALSGVYGIVSLLMLAGDRFRRGARVVTLTLDTLLITMWVQATVVREAVLDAVIVVVAAACSD
jgi:hypothetical protein